MSAPSAQISKPLYEGICIGPLPFRGDDMFHFEESRALLTFWHGGKIVKYDGPHYDIFEKDDSIETALRRAREDCIAYGITPESTLSLTIDHTRYRCRKRRLFREPYARTSGHLYDFIEEIPLTAQTTRIWSSKEPDVIHDSLPLTYGVIARQLT